MNKKRAAFLTAAALVASAVGMSGASARPVKDRTVEATYQTPAPAVIAEGGGAAVCNFGGAAGSSRGCMEFIAARGERWVRFQITDATGMPIPAFVQYDGDGIADWIPFCGSSESMPAFGTIYVYVIAYPTPDHGLCHGAATTGTVTATFSARR